MIGGAKKKLATSFSPVASLNIGISAQNFLNSSLSRSATLL